MLSTCSAHAQHVPQHVPQLSNIQYPISNNEVSNNQKPKDNISSADAVGELFEEFWDAYDRKDGRAAAEKAWRRLTSEEKQLAADNAPAMREAQPDRKYRPMPATYLNGKRWLDQSIHEESQPVRRAESYCEKPSAEGIAEGKRLQYLLDAGLPI